MSTEPQSVVEGLPDGVRGEIQRLVGTGDAELDMRDGALMPVAARSLRAGFVTSAVEAGKRADRIAATSGHRSDRMIRVYTRVSDAFTDAAAEGLL